MMPRKGVFHFSPRGICRICLRHGRDIVDALGPNEPHLMQNVKDYFRVEITGNDGRSSKVCKYCIRKIQIWQGHVVEAQLNQRVVEYFSNKEPHIVITSEIENEEPLSVPNKKRKTTSRKSKRRKSTSTIPSTSNVMTQSPLESIQQSALASISQCQSIDTQYVSDVPSTSTSTSMEIIPIASTSAEFISSTSTSTEVIPYASTSTVVIPTASTSTEDIPYASTSTVVIPTASTSVEVIPYASTSTVVIPTASTSVEVIPFASSSSIEIVPSYTVNEISSTGDNPVWYPNENEKTYPDSEFDDRNESCKVEHVDCIFCTYQHKEVSLNAYSRVIFCSKHSEPYACLIENCHCVFPYKNVFIQHYRTHLNLDSSAFLCSKCLSVLTCPRRTVTKDHTHQNLSELCKCCSLTFTTMTKFVLHKLKNHITMVVSSHNHMRVLPKQNLNIQKTELDDIKVGLDVPGTVPCNHQKVKDNGSIECYRCPKKFNNILDFIDHSKIRHKNLITLKDKEIKLCPLCENSYFNEHFTEHLEKCTNTMLVGDKSLNHYGCVYCEVIFTNVSSREFRNHVLYCKSFTLGIVSNKLNHKCMHCSFTSTDDYLSLVHANSNCIYFQLKMRYAMGPEETNKVIQRMEFVKQNTEQQEDKDCTNDGEILSSSKTFCNTARQRLLQIYNFFCNNCENHFFDMNIFCKHLTETGSHCRLQTLIYCQKCLTEFNTMEEYEGHLPSMPEASPLLLTVKEELLQQNNDEYGDLPMDVVHINPNYPVVKVEMNNETFYQKQEPIDGTSYYNIGIMQEQEQEVSNNHYNNSVFSCPEMELTINDIDMECEVEEKVDINK